MAVGVRSTRLVVTALPAVRLFRYETEKLRMLASQLRQQPTNLPNRRGGPFDMLKLDIGEAFGAENSLMPWNWRCCRADASWNWLDGFNRPDEWTTATGGPMPQCAKPARANLGRNAMASGSGWAARRCPGHAAPPALRAATIRQVRVHRALNHPDEQARKRARSSRNSGPQREKSRF